MNEPHANQAADPRVRHYLRLAIEASVLRNKAKIAAAVCDHKLGVEEAFKRYGLTLGDFIEYLTAAGFDRLKSLCALKPAATKNFKSEKQNPGKMLDWTL